MPYNLSMMKIKNLNHRPSHGGHKQSVCAAIQWENRASHIEDPYREKTLGSLTIRHPVPGVIEYKFIFILLTVVV